MENTLFKTINTIYLAISGFFISQGLNFDLFSFWATLLLLDFTSAIIREVIISSREDGRISFRTLRSKVGISGFAIKCFVFIIPLTIGIQSKMLGLDPTKFIDTSITVFAVLETYSVLSNVQSSITGKRLPEAEVFNLISLLIKKLQKYFLHVVETLLKVDYDKDGR